MRSQRSSSGRRSSCRWASSAAGSPTSAPRLSQLVASQELERQRLAVELHDDAAQSLAAALLALGRVESSISVEQADASRAELRALIQQTLERVRELAVDLRPRVLDDLGLPAAAHHLAATFSARTGLPVEVDLDEERRLPAEIELPLFRVLQEALQSVTERTDATRVRVTLTTTPTGTVFEVADDGSVVRHGPGTRRRRLAVGAGEAAPRRWAAHGPDAAGGRNDRPGHRSRLSRVGLRRSWARPPDQTRAPDVGRMGSNRLC